MVLRRLPTAHALLAVLEQPTSEMRRLRGLLTAGGRFPSRRAWERRLTTVPATLPAQIACLGTHLAARFDPWRDRGRAGAIDRTSVRARGGVWHKKHRAAGEGPSPLIDTEAHWTKSGWHGWVSGWKLHLVITVAAVWLPLRAALMPANAADNKEAPALLADLPAEVRFVLADGQDHDAALPARLAAAGRILVANRRGPYPHRDPGAEGRRVLHQERSVAIEHFNGQVKAIVDVNGPMPTRGLAATARWVLGAVFVDQLTLLLRDGADLGLRRGLKPFLQAA